MVVGSCGEVVLLEVAAPSASGLWDGTQSEKEGWAICGQDLDLSCAPLLVGGLCA